MSGSGYSSLPKAPGSVPAATGPDPPAIKFTDSNLQTFLPYEAKGKISGAYHPPTDADGQIRSPSLSPFLPLGPRPDLTCLWCLLDAQTCSRPSPGAVSVAGAAALGQTMPGRAGGSGCSPSRCTSPTSRTSENPDLYASIA
ncbi:hypothetical protein GUJ93_ZPchr0007g3738 [Zizania palustris]|uniref:Uncharacterized protein n=1 Tax=Zizania palustris TaxID=103762 RepID=A0A8J5SVB5_ZIZPA|nr:hypothetical protein GUJ93_ZPchr0007g3738 [Zizania palustris]